MCMHDNFKNNTSLFNEKEIACAFTLKQEKKRNKYQILIVNKLEYKRKKPFKNIYSIELNT